MAYPIEETGSFRLCEGGGKDVPCSVPAQSALLECAGTAIHNDCIGPLGHCQSLKADTKPNVAGPRKTDGDCSRIVVQPHTHCQVKLQEDLRADDHTRNASGLERGRHR